MDSRWRSCLTSVRPDAQKVSVPQQVVKRVAQMNVLTLEVYVDHWSTQAVRVLIDGMDLAELARPIEQLFADAENHPDIAGSYGGLALKDVAVPSRRFWGDESIYGNRARTATH